MTPNDSYTITKRSFFSIFLISLCLALYFSSTLFAFIIWFVTFFVFLFALTKLIQIYLTTAHKNPYGRFNSLLNYSRIGSFPNVNTPSSHYNQMYTPPLETDTRDIDVDSVYNANKVCFYCGNHIDTGDNFCQSCGKERT